VPPTPARSANPAPPTSPDRHHPPSPFGTRPPLRPRTPCGRHTPPPTPTPQCPPPLRQTIRPPPHPPPTPPHHRPHLTRTPSAYPPPPHPPRPPAPCALSPPLLLALATGPPPRHLPPRRTPTIGDPFTTHPRPRALPPTAPSIIQPPSLPLPLTTLPSPRPPLRNPLLSQRLPSRAPSSRPCRSKPRPPTSLPLCENSYPCSRNALVPPSPRAPTPPPSSPALPPLSSPRRQRLLVGDPKGADAPLPPPCARSHPRQQQLERPPHPRIPLAHLSRDADPLPRPLPSPPGPSPTHARRTRHDPSATPTAPLPLPRRMSDSTRETLLLGPPSPRSPPPLSLPRTPTPIRPTFPGTRGAFTIPTYHPCPWPSAPSALRQPHPQSPSSDPSPPRLRPANPCARNPPSPPDRPPPRTPPPAHPPPPIPARRRRSLALANPLDSPLSGPHAIPHLTAPTWVPAAPLAQSPHLATTRPRKRATNAPSIVPLDSPRSTESRARASPSAPSSLSTHLAPILLSSSSPPALPLLAACLLHSRLPHPLCDTNPAAHPTQPVTQFPIVAMRTTSFHPAQVRRNPHPPRATSRRGTTPPLPLRAPARAAPTQPPPPAPLPLPTLRASTLLTASFPTTPLAAIPSPARLSSFPRPAPSATYHDHWGSRPRSLRPRGTPLALPTPSSRAPPPTLLRNPSTPLPLPSARILAPHPAHHPPSPPPPNSAPRPPPLAPPPTPAPRHPLPGRCLPIPPPAHPQPRAATPLTPHPGPRQRSRTPRCAPLLTAEPTPTTGNTVVTHCPHSEAHSSPRVAAEPTKNTHTRKRKTPQTAPPTPPRKQSKEAPPPPRIASSLFMSQPKPHCVDPRLLPHSPCPPSYLDPLAYPRPAVRNPGTPHSFTLAQRPPLIH